MADEGFIGFSLDGILRFIISQMIGSLKSPFSKGGSMGIFLEIALTCKLLSPLCSI